MKPLAGLTIVLAVAVVMLVAAGSASAASNVIKVGSDVNVGPEQTVGSVVAVGGNVTVAGTVRKTIVAVGGDVHLQNTAQVGTGVKAGDTSIWLVGGKLTKASGATVQGDTSTVVGSWAGHAWGSGARDSVLGFFGSSGFRLVSWAGSTIVALLGALLFAVLLPRQVEAVAGRVGHRFWPSLGWGALGLIVVVPVVTVLLVVSIVGLLAILPWLFVVVAGLVVGAIGVSTLIGEWILPRLSYRGSSLALAAVVGVLVVQLVALIPVVGSIVEAVVWVVGFGAAVLALWGWQQRRRQQEREAPEVDSRAA